MTEEQVMQAFVEFNPYRSINCQARSCALFVTLVLKGDLEQATSSPETFLELLSQSTYRPHLEEQPKHENAEASQS